MVERAIRRHLCVPYADDCDTCTWRMPRKRCMASGLRCSALLSVLRERSMSQHAHSTATGSVIRSLVRSLLACVSCDIRRVELSYAVASIWISLWVMVSTPWLPSAAHEIADLVLLTDEQAEGFLHRFPLVHILE